MKKRSIVLIAGIVLAVIVVGQFMMELQQGNKSEWNWWKDPWAEHYADLGRGPITYTYSPIDIDSNQFEYIIPLGHISIPQHPIPTDHIYFVTEAVDKGMAGTFPAPDTIRAPADGVIVRIYKFRWTETQSGREYDDYHFWILHTNTFQTFLGHIYDPDEHILQQAGELKYGENYVWIPVKAGEILGGGAGLDMGTFNKEVTLNFIRPERYEPLMIHTVCPLDYFEDNLKARLYEKVMRIGEPKCGKIDYDQPGKLVGNWFLEGSPISLYDMTSDSQLSFVYDVFNASKIKIGFGNGLGIPENLTAYDYIVEDGPDPANVSVTSGPVIYRLRGAGTDVWITILVQMVEENKIKVEGFEGYLLHPAFTNGAKYYTR